MEFRKDYVLDRWVYLATERRKRPREFKAEKKEENSKSCAFCPGHEKETPPEKGRIKENGKWTIRWFNNLYAALEKKGDYKVKTENTFFTYSNSWGEHEVIVETPRHKEQLWDLDAEKIKKILDIYNNRIQELEKLEGIKYVDVFKNHGLEAGTSLVHSHTQVMALSKVPKLVRRKVKAIKKFGEECPYCSIVEIEMKGERRCFESNSFAAFCPYASRFNYEIWVFPKKHVTRMDKLGDEELLDLADIMKKILLKIKELNASYNFFLQYSPEKENLHFHIEFTPRIARWGGFEHSSETIINSVSPEDAAKFYRGEVKLEKGS